MPIFAVTVQETTIEVPMHRKGRPITCRRAVAYAVRGTEDVRHWRDILQPYEHGHGARKRAERAAREQAEERGARLVLPSPLPGETITR